MVKVHNCRQLSPSDGRGILDEFFAVLVLLCAVGEPRCDPLHSAPIEVCQKVLCRASLMMVDVCEGQQMSSVMCTPVIYLSAETTHYCSVLLCLQDFGKEQKEEDILINSEDLPDVVDYFCQPVALITRNICQSTTFTV